MLPLEYEPPGVDSFDLPPIFESVPWLDKYVLMATVSVVLILAFWLVNSRRLSMVPGKRQFATEFLYDFWYSPRHNTPRYLRTAAYLHAIRICR